MRAWCFVEPHGLAGQQLPTAVLFVPHHQDADLHWIGRPVTFGLAG
jgi:hypothetical protein